MQKVTQLPFEKPIYDIEAKIDELKKLSAESGIDLSKQIETLTLQSNDFRKKLYDNLKPYERKKL